MDTFPFQPASFPWFLLPKSSPWFEICRDHHISLTHVERERLTCCSALRFTHCFYACSPTRALVLEEPGPEAWEEHLWVHWLTSNSSLSASAPMLELGQDKTPRHPPYSLDIFFTQWCFSHRALWLNVSCFHLSFFHIMPSAISSPLLPRHWVSGPMIDCDECIFINMFVSH